MQKIYHIFIIFLNLTVTAQNPVCINLDSMKTKKIDIGERKISLTTLNKKETKELITSLNGNENRILSEKYSARAFTLSDGRFILMHEGGGALYHSAEDVEDLMRFLKKESKSHPLIEGLPYKLEYLTHINSIIDEFSKKIGVDNLLLDRSVESLSVIEKRLKSLKLDEFQLEKEYLVYLMTYSGEVIRNKVGGAWTLLKLNVEGKEVLEPVIRVDQSRDYSPLWPIVNEFAENSTKFALSSAIAAEIQKYMLLDFMLSKKK